MQFTFYQLGAFLAMMPWSFQAGDDEVFDA